jgi:hypothetical protein
MPLSIHRRHGAMHDVTFAAIAMPARPTYAASMHLDYKRSKSHRIPR